MASTPDTSKGSLVHIRSLVAGLGGDMDAVVALVCAAARKHQEMGGKLAIHAEGKRQPVRLVGNKMVDDRGNPWGVAALAFDLPGQPNYVEFAPIGSDRLTPETFAKLSGLARK